jgi:hypothetical protein
MNRYIGKKEERDIDKNKKGSTIDRRDFLQCGLMGGAFPALQSRNQNHAPQLPVGWKRQLLVSSSMLWNLETSLRGT